MVECCTPYLILKGLFYYCSSSYYSKYYIYYFYFNAILFTFFRTYNTNQYVKIKSLEKYFLYNTLLDNPICPISK